MIVGFVVAGLTIGVTLAGYIAWQAGRERKLLLAEVVQIINTTVRTEIKTTVNGQINGVGEKVDAMRSENHERWLTTEARLASGAQQFNELHRVTESQKGDHERLVDRFDRLVDAQQHRAS